MKLKLKTKPREATLSSKSRIPGIHYDETAHSSDAEEIIDDPISGEPVTRGEVSQKMKKWRKAARQQKHRKEQPVLNVAAARQWEAPWTRLHAELVSDPAFATLPRSAMQVMFYLLGEHARNYKATTKLKVRLVDMHRVCQWSLRSADTLREALDTLITRRLIRRTSERRGSDAATYAITWLERKRFDAD